MLLVGGGHSHNDMFVPVMAGVVGLVVGAFLGPRLIGTALVALEPTPSVCVTSPRILRGVLRDVRRLLLRNLYR
jgi:hypothetical protein